MVDVDCSYQEKSMKLFMMYIILSIDIISCMCRMIEISKTQSNLSAYSKVEDGKKSTIYYQG